MWCYRIPIVIASLLLLFTASDALANTVVSDFDDGTLDGWVKDPDGDGTLSNPLSGGNPDGYLSCYDPAQGVNTWAAAPSKFLGDWSAYDTTGNITFHMKIISTGGSITEKPNVWLEGPGGTAPGPRSGRRSSRSRGPRRTFLPIHFGPG